MQNHPEAFAESYWAVNSLRVYSDDGTPAAQQKNVQPSESTPVAAPVAEVASSPSDSEAPSSTPQAQAPSPPETPTQLAPPTHTHAHGEVYESSETGVANLTIAPREATAHNEKRQLISESLAEDADVASTVEIRESLAEPEPVKSGRRVARHLHRHSHGARHHRS